MRSKVFTMPAALLLLLFFSCNQGQYTDGKAVVAKAPAAAPELAPASTSAADSAVASSDNLTDEANEQSPRFKSPSPGSPNKQPHISTPSQPAANPDWDRKIVRTADLSIAVKSFPAFTDRLHRIVHETGGYIAQEDLSQSPAEIENAISIKVPVERFDDLLQQLPADSDRLTEKKVSSQDVSMELVDTKSRLQTKMAVRERYRELLQQAHKMEDILSIQQEIDGIQGEMDAAAGRINYLGHAATYSTINLKFFQILNHNAIETPSSEPGFLHKIRLSILEGWQYLSALILGLLSVWPLWLALGLGLIAWRRHQSRMPKKVA